MSSHLYLMRRSNLCPAMCECDTHTQTSTEKLCCFSPESTQQHIHYYTNHRSTYSAYTHAALYVHTTSHTYDRPRQSLIPFMAAPELGFKYIFHATLPPMAANEGKKGGRLRDEARQQTADSFLCRLHVCLYIPFTSSVLSVPLLSLSPCFL